MMIYYLRSTNRYALHPLKIAISEFSLRRFSFFRWLGKISNVHIIFIQLLGTRDRLMNHISFESRTNDKIYNITHYGHWRHSHGQHKTELHLCMLFSDISLSRAARLHHDHIQNWLWLQPIDNASTSFAREMEKATSGRSSRHAELWIMFAIW